MNSFECFKAVANLSMHFLRKEITWSAQIGSASDTYMVHPKKQEENSRGVASKRPNLH